MRRSVWLWIIAIVVTAFSAHWQRASGPTYALPVSARLGATTFRGALDRTHAGPGDHRVELGQVPADVSGTLEWKRFRSTDPWTAVPLRREGESLVGELPHQGIGGKLWYRLRLVREGDSALIPTAGPATLRFRQHVPPWLLVPHILFMLAALLYSTRAGLEVFDPRGNVKPLAYRALALLFIGGLVLGPIVVHATSGSWWTGFPVGSDLTDNKTLIALAGWIGAVLALRQGRDGRGWAAFAALLMLLVFMVPHSWLGAEPGHAALDAPPAATGPAR
ncbi:MAG: hypothetical protein HZC42_10915 [Candidatus Eisenbacteria bacterium]|nr:hypothetical protein [Candidatus Eisenbacteria bacterium]